MLSLLTIVINIYKLTISSQRFRDFFNLRTELRNDIHAMNERSIEYLNKINDTNIPTDIKNIVLKGLQNKKTLNEIKNSIYEEIDKKIDGLHTFCMNCNHECILKFYKLLIHPLFNIMCIYKCLAQDLLNFYSEYFEFLHKFYIANRNIDTAIDQFYMECLEKYQDTESMLEESGVNTAYEKLEKNIISNYGILIDLFCFNIPENYYDLIKPTKEFKYIYHFAKTFATDTKMLTYTYKLQCFINDRQGEGQFFLNNKAMQMYETTLMVANWSMLTFMLEYLIKYKNEFDHMSENFSNRFKVFSDMEIKYTSWRISMFNNIFDEKISIRDCENINYVSLFEYLEEIKNEFIWLYETLQSLQCS